MLLAKRVDDLYVLILPLLLFSYQLLDLLVLKDPFSFMGV